MDHEIGDADRSVLSWTHPPDVIGLDLISVDCSLASVPATAGGADGAVTDDNLGC